MITVININIDIISGLLGNPCQSFFLCLQFLQGDVLPVIDLHELLNVLLSAFRLLLASDVAS